jgi:hypothetical protein
MPNRSVPTQHIGYGVDTGVARTPQRRTIRRPITIRTTGIPTPTMAGLSAGDFLAAADILAADFTAALDMSAVDFVAEAVDTSVVATVATGRGWQD